MTLDRTVVERAIRGEASAIERVLSECRPDLHRYATKVCPQWSEIEDAVQSSLISIYRGIGRLEAAGAFVDWATRIVRRQCWKTLRPISSVGLEGIAEERAYLATRDEAELRMDVARALQALPAIHRDVLVLRDLEGLSVREVAARLGVEVGTVKSRLHRARGAVREYLLADGPPPLPGAELSRQ